MATAREKIDAMRAARPGWQPSFYFQPPELIDPAGHNPLHDEDSWGELPTLSKPPKPPKAGKSFRKDMSWLDNSRGGALVGALRPPRIQKRPLGLADLLGSEFVLVARKAMPKRIDDGSRRAAADAGNDR